MFSLPPMPAWEGLHPLIVHFPVALLLVAPLLVVAGMVFGKQARALQAAALALMLLGTAAAWLAISTGDAAKELVSETPRLEAAIERHEELAEATRNVFTGLTVLFAALLVVPALMRIRPARLVTVGVHGLFLAFYAAGALVLANTAHQGGRLVHEYGVRAMISAAPTAAPLAEVPAQAGEAARGDGDRDKD